MSAVPQIRAGGFTAPAAGAHHAAPSHAVRPVAHKQAAARRPAPMRRQAPAPAAGEAKRWRYCVSCRDKSGTVRTFDIDRDLPISTVEDVRAIENTTFQQIGTKVAVTSWTATTIGLPDPRPVVGVDAEWPWRYWVEFTTTPTHQATGSVVRSAPIETGRDITVVEKHLSAQAGRRVHLNCWTLMRGPAGAR